MRFEDLLRYAESLKRPPKYYCILTNDELLQCKINHGVNNLEELILL